jgi:hypothetical protein
MADRPPQNKSLIYDTMTNIIILWKHKARFFAKVIYTFAIVKKELLGKD